MNGRRVDIEYVMASLLSVVKGEEVRGFHNESRVFGATMKVCIYVSQKEGR